MKNIINVLISIFVLSTHTLAQTTSLTPEMEQLTGCWNDSESKEWRYGFFEKLAVYDNDFWEYQSLDFKKNKAEIVLKKGKDLLKLKLTFDNKADSICTITSSAQKGKRKFVRYSSAPDLTKEDHSTLVDNGYKQDSVTVIGYMRKVSQNFPVEITVPSFLNDDNDNYTVKIDSSGCFRITIPVINTSEAIVSFRNHKLYFNIIVEPGDTTLIFYNADNKDIRIMGHNSRLNQELINYDKDPCKKQLDELHISHNAKMDHDTFMLKQQKNYSKRKEILKEYISRHPLLSDKFKSYERNNALMQHACFIMQRRFELRRNFNKESFSKKYMEYADSLYQQVPQPYALYGNVFLTDYYEYYNNLMTANWTSIPIEILGYANNKNEFELTNQQKSDLFAYEEVMSNRILGAHFGIDSLEIETVNKPHIEAFKRAQQLLENEKVAELCKKYESINNEIMEIRRIKKEFTYFDSIVVPPILKELIVTKKFCAFLYHGKTAFKKPTIDYFKSLVNNKSLREKVLKQQEAYVLLAKQELQHIESLKKNDDLKDITEANELLKRLIAPYKEKVIYMDFWGTWCSPCKEEMKYAPAIKEALKDKEVIFMYLANNSPEESWKNVIKENHLTGPNIVHYNLPYEQQKILEKHLSVNSFPTFILLDKEGNIIDKNAPRPSQEKTLINRINELLTK